MVNPPTFPHTVQAGRHTTVRQDERIIEYRFVRLTRPSLLKCAVSTRKWVQQIIDEAWDTIQNPEGYRKIDGEALFVDTKLYPWGKERRRCYMLLYYNAHAAAAAADGFTEELLTYKEKLESGQLTAATKMLTTCPPADT